MVRFPHQPTRGSRTLLLVLVAVCGAAGLVGACSRGTEPSAPAGTEPGPVAREVASDGPRALAATFVPLEIDRFPRPADEACADPARTVRVAEGSSIAEALRAAEAGTAVLVEPGTYTEPDDGDARALVLAEPGVCLRADGDGAVVVRAAPGQSTGVEISADSVVVEGITLQGFRTGVALDREGGTVRDVTLQRLRVEQLAGDFREGVIAFGDNQAVPGTPPAVDGLLVLDVVVDGADLGVSCNAGPCAHWWLEGVRVQGRAGREDTAADAVAIEDGRQIAVVGSTVSGAGGDGIDTKADDVVVVDCAVRDVDRNGVKLWRGGDVINTVVDGTGADAALVGDQPGRYRYLHVLVTHHLRPGEEGYVGTWGYDTGEPVLLEIVNSIVADNGGSGFWVPAGSTVVLRRTLVDDASAKLLDVGDERSVTVAERASLADLGWEVDLVVGDPQLRDPAHGDDVTLPASPARDAGVAVEGLDHDAAGNARWIGAGPDLGPFEATLGE